MVLAVDEAEGEAVVDVEVGGELLLLEIREGEAVGGMIEVVRVRIEVEIEEIGTEGVGSPKEAVVWREKKGMVEKGAFAIVPLAMAEWDGEGRVWFPVPFQW